MAHTKAQKAAKGNKDSKPKYRGVKIFGDQVVKKGNIIVRQAGSKFHAGDGTKLGRDYTIYAMRDGVVKFVRKVDKKYVFVKAA